MVWMVEWIAIVVMGVENKHQMGRLVLQVNFVMEGGWAVCAVDSVRE